MNYILETNAFYDWLETNPLSANAINVWHALMSVSNKTYWKEDFTVAISVLELKTGLSKKSIERGRTELAKRKRLTWKKRSGNQSAEYTLISFVEEESLEDAQVDAQVDAQPDAQVVVQTVSQPVAINKLNQTKQSIFIDDEEFFLVDSLQATLTALLEDRSYLELMCMNFKIRDIPILENHLKQFFAELSTRGEVYKSEKDAKSHFANWLKIQLKKKGTHYAQNQSTHTPTIRLEDNSSSTAWRNTANASPTGLEAIINSISIGG